MKCKAIFIVLISVKLALLSNARNLEPEYLKNLSPQEFVAQMGAGWNLGNTLDTYAASETAWGNPKTTKAMIDEIAARGFKTLRVPVTWNFHIGNAPSYVIQKAWLDRVEEVVNYGLANDMFVIVNMHHDNSWVVPTYQRVEGVKDKLGKVWRQIAERFKDYDERLIFETLNEPRLENSPNEWNGGTAEGRDCINQFHKTILDEIRASGSKNKHRFVMVSTYAASTNTSAMNDLKIPNNDPKTIISVHTYYPYQFALEGSRPTWGSQADKNSLDAELDRIYDKFIAKGKAVVMGEWGSTHQNNLEYRVIHAEHYAKACAKRGICPVVWDNGNSKEFGIFNRFTRQWYYPEIADIIVKSTNIQVSSGNPIIKHIRSADAAAEVWNDGKVWVYASHDMDDAVDYSTMDGYHVFSSYDLVNWTDHGEILHSRDVSWRNPNGGFMFAPDAAYKNDTYYLYFPHLGSDWKWHVGVATSSKPEGPFTDIGRYIAGTDHIDPCCFVDDDGEAYLIWGGDGQGPKIARLKDNMTELAETPKIIDYGGTNFGEGPYLHKKDGKYYFSYTCHTCSGFQGYYAMGDNPYGPFEYKGNLNPNPPGAQDHHSIIEYHGQSYYFYHVGNYSGGSLHRRNICIDSLHYNADGTMKVVVQTKYGVGQDTIGATPGILIPQKIEAENFFRRKGAQMLEANDSTTFMGEIKTGDWFNFILEVPGTEEYQTSIKCSDTKPGTKIILYVDDKISDTLVVENQTDTLKTTVLIYKGKHTFKLQFENEGQQTDLIKTDWIEFNGKNEYISVNLSSTGNGKIIPSGTHYLIKGDSLQVQLVPDTNYNIDSLFVNGNYRPTNGFFTLKNILENQVVEAGFKKCSAVQPEPWFQINDSSLLNGSRITVTEEDRLFLKVEAENPDQVFWQTPDGSESNGESLLLSMVRINDGGIYKAFYTDNSGCTSEISFFVQVENLKLDVYEAEEWTYQSGVQLENCTDRGGGQHLVSIENNDLCFYQFTIDTPGVYEITARVATALDGGSIEIADAKGVLASIPVSGEFSEAWDDWYTTAPIEIEFGAGIQRLKFTFKGNTGQLFNFNWFDLKFVRPTSISSFSNKEWLTCYPTSGKQFTIEYQINNAEKTGLDIFDLNGKWLHTIKEMGLQQPGRYTYNWNTNSGNTNIQDGIYLLVFSSSKSKITKWIVVSN